MPDPAPRVLSDRYELRAPVGQGGMAEVHRGFDRVLGREVAVKLMHAAFSRDVDRRRFEAETRLLARLNDPHLVTLLDAGVEGTGGAPRPWLVMELVTGPTLARRLAEGPLPADEVAAIGADLAAALAHVHANGIVHRDVKPANILLTETGSAKLADFGIARLTAEQSDLTGTGLTMGTAAYLAPEQVRGLPVSGAADVYALGLVLLEALTGQRTYPGTPTEAALARLHRGPLIPVSLGAGWTRVLDAMTASDPASRLDAAGAAAQLRTLLRGGLSSGAADASADLGTTGLIAVTAARETSTSATAARSPWRHSVLTGAAVLAAVVLTMALVRLIADGDSPASTTGAVAQTPTADDATKVPSRRPTPTQPTSSAPSTTPVNLSRPAKTLKADPSQRTSKQKKARQAKKAKQAEKAKKPGKGRGNGKGKGRKHKR